MKAPKLYRLLSLLVLCWAVQHIAAQDKPLPELARFEVATVKPSDPNVPHMVGLQVNPGGRVIISSLSLKALIGTAFRLSYWQISGGDAWMEKDAYNVEAKPPETVGVQDLRYTVFAIEDEHLREMLQALLIDRFQLKFHRETKTADIYLLVRNNKTLTLRPSEAPSAGAHSPADSSSFGSIGYAGGRWVIHATDMPQLAKFASDYFLHAPVLDQTGLKGSFDYRQNVPDAEPNYSDNADSFLRLIPDLGLQFERSKGPADIFLIDSAAKPSSN